MLDKLKEFLNLSEQEKKEVQKDRRSTPQAIHLAGEDPWGLNVNKAIKSLKKSILSISTTSK